MSLNRDKNGNKVIIFSNGDVCLYLKNETRNREIGNIDENGNYHKFVEPNHYHRKGEGWGICYMVLEMLDPDKKVIIHEVKTGDKYFLKVEDILNHKHSYIQHSKQGFELQIIIPKKDLIMM